MDPDFSGKVAAQIARLQAGPLPVLEREVAERRIAWFRARHPEPPRLGQAAPRQGFELLFREYMGLSPEDLPIVKENATEIVWESRNPCQTLEACLALGLDTRRVCRGAYEKSTQALLSCLDPQLRFLRSYVEIRPHAAFCRERIVRVDFEGMMRLALAEAVVSRREGNKGYGAVVALGDRIVGQAHDTAATAGDPSLHAEVNAIRQAVTTLGDPDLSGAVLFSTCEPCPMCASLAVWANLSAIVYGASIQETAALGKLRIRVGAGEIAGRAPVLLEVLGGVLREPCLALYGGASPCTGGAP
jgi:tRNA(Arg) A34 adenosine deaminase TadA